MQTPCIRDHAQVALDMHVQTQIVLRARLPSRFPNASPIEGDACPHPSHRPTIFIEMNLTSHPCVEQAKTLLYRSYISITSITAASKKTRRHIVILAAGHLAPCM